MKVFGAEARPPAAASHRLSCFFRPSTLRKDMDSEVPLLWTEQIRTMTLTWGQEESDSESGLGGRDPPASSATTNRPRSD